MQLCKYFFGLSQLVFGGGVLGVVFDFSPEKAIDLAVSLVVTAMLATFGWALIKRSNRKLV